MRTIKIKTNDNWTSADGKVYNDGSVAVANGQVTVDGITCPIISVKSFKLVKGFQTAVAYDDTKPVQPVKKAVEQPVQPVQKAEPAQPASKPRFRMHKVETAQPKPVAKPEPVAEPAPAEPAQPALEELVAKVKELIEPAKADYEGTIDLPDGGRIEIRYFKA